MPVSFERVDFRPFRLFSMKWRRISPRAGQGGFRVFAGQGASLTLCNGVQLAIRLSALTSPRGRPSTRFQEPKDRLIAVEPPSYRTFQFPPSQAGAEGRATGRLGLGTASGLSRTHFHLHRQCPKQLMATFFFIR